MIYFLPNSTVTYFLGPSKVNIFQLSHIYSSRNESNLYFWGKISKWNCVGVPSELREWRQMHFALAGGTGQPPHNWTNENFKVAQMSILHSMQIYLVNFYSRWITIWCNWLLTWKALRSPKYGSKMNWRQHIPLLFSNWTGWRTCQCWNWLKKTKQ